MAGRKRSENDHHPADQQTKRSQRIETGEAGTHPFHNSKRAEADAGTKHHEKKAPDADDVSASKSLGIAESAARDRGESVPTTPYSRGQA